MPVLKPPSSAPLLTFGAANYAVQVNIGSFAIPIWTWLRGIGKFDPTFEPTMADDSDIDSDNYGSSLTTSQKFNIAIEGMIKGVQSGASVIPDPGSAFLRSAGQKTAQGNVVQLRYWRTDDIDEGYVAYFAVKFTDVGGGISDFQKFTATLSGRGRPEKIVRPQSTAVNEVQLVSLSNATGGTFTLSFLGQVTSALAYNVTTAALQTALTGLAAIGANNAVVTGSVGAYVVTFTGALAGVNVPELIPNGAALTGNGAGIGVTVVAQGAPVAA